MNRRLFLSSLASGLALLRSNPLQGPGATPPPSLPSRSLPDSFVFERGTSVLWRIVVDWSGRKVTLFADGKRIPNVLTVSTSARAEVIDVTSLTSSRTETLPSFETLELEFVYQSTMGVIEVNVEPTGKYFHADGREWVFVGVIRQVKGPFGYAS